MQPVAFIPSPSQGVWHLGPVPLRAYALMIIIGIVVAVWSGERRWAAKGGAPGVIIDVAVWAVPFGLVGGRLYHVITDYQRYFGDGREPVDAFKIWEGGLGIWGAVVLGAVGAIIGCRRHGVSVLALGDAVAPGIALGQAIGRWGNYWNQELYGRPLDTFWALEIDQAHRPRLSDGSLDPKYADVATYHPTFLYESLWCVGVAVLVIWAGRRYKLTHGRSFPLYVAAYTVGRFWIEWLRIDDAHHVLGMRLNDWTSLIVFLGAVAYLYWAREKTGPENVGAVPAEEEGPAADGTAQAAPAADTDADEPQVSAAAVTETVQAADSTSSEDEDESKPEGASEEKAEPESEEDPVSGPETDSVPENEPVAEKEPTPEPDPEPESASAQEPDPEPDPEPEPEPASETASATGEHDDEGPADEAERPEEPTGSDEAERVKDAK